MPAGKGRTATITRPAGGSDRSVAAADDSDNPSSAIDARSGFAIGTFAARAIGRARDRGGTTPVVRTLHPSAWENDGGARSVPAWTAGDAAAA